MIYVLIGIVTIVAIIVLASYGGRLIKDYFRAVQDQRHYDALKERSDTLEDFVRRLANLDVGNPEVEAGVLLYELNRKALKNGYELD